MDQENNQIPFDSDFDSGSNSTPAAGIDVAAVNPLMAFYAGIACSVVVFGLAGIIFLLTLNN